MYRVLNMATFLLHQRLWGVGVVVEGDGRRTGRRRRWKRREGKGGSMVCVCVFNPFTPKFKNVHSPNLSRRNAQVR